MLLCTWRLCFCKWPDWLKLLLHSEHLYGLSPVWTLVWRFRCPDWLNALSHMWHLYGFSPVWTLMWVFRYPDLLNALSHMWHLYGFSPLWILLCVTRSPVCLNRLLQTVHSNGFSPECFLMCTARWLLLSQHLPHSVHLYIPLWIFICLRRPVCVENCFSRWPHVYTFSPVWLCLWLFKFLFVVNRLSHTSETYFFSPCCVLLLSVNLGLVCHQLYSFPEMSFLLDKHQQMSRCNTLHLLQYILLKSVYSDKKTNKDIQRHIKKDKHTNVHTWYGMYTDFNFHKINKTNSVLTR